VSKHEKERHGHHRRHRHHHRLAIFFFQVSIFENGEGVSIRMITSILNNDPKGAFVQIVETDASGAVVASSGPFAIEVVDQTPPIATVTAGSPDNTTPTRIVGNGTGVGSVTVNVTDTSNGAKGSAVLQILAPPPPPPPPVPTLTVGFVPGS
jgi:hypothetical protein